MLQWTTFCLWMVVLSLSVVECDLKCGGQIRNSSGTIVLKSPTESHCTWAIVVSKILGVRFRISALRVSQTDPNTCHDSYLKLEEVRGERRTLLKDYCKSVSRDYIKTRHNHVVVSAYNVAFKLTWDVTAPRGTKRKKDEMSTPLGNDESTVETTTENDFINFFEEKKYIVLAVLVASGMCITFIITFTAMKIKMCVRRRGLGVMSEENHEMHVMSELRGQLSTTKSLQHVSEEIYRQEMEDDYDGYEEVDKSDDQNDCSKTKTGVPRQNTSTRHQQKDGRETTTHMEDRCPDPPPVCRQENADDLNDYINQFYHGGHHTASKQEMCHRAGYSRIENTEGSTLYVNNYQVMSGARRSYTPSTSSDDSADYVNITEAI